MATRGRPVLTPLPPRKLSKVSRDSNEDENQVVPFSIDGDEFHDNINNHNNSTFERRLSLETRERGKPDKAWDEESQESRYFSNESSDSESERDETYKSRRASEQPESPSRRGHLSQQSEDDESDDETIKASTLPVTLAPVSVMSVDLSRLSKLSVFPGTETNLVQGHILRVKTMLSSQYHYFINAQLVLMAEKQVKTRTSNYHLFDMTRSAVLSSKLTKKSGNYIGKLRSNFSKKKNVLVGNFSRKTELGAMVFGSTFNSSEPRKLTVILPPISRRQEIEGLTVGDSLSTFSMLLDLHRSLTDANMAVAHSALPPESLQVFENKEPIFENGFYRLNFNGRVSVPSVKNFQLVRADDYAVPNPERPIYLQFGKVDDKKFHLDFRAPITPIQAFATALAQFNL